MSKWESSLGLAVVLVVSSCIGHLDPSKDHEKIAEEQSAANVPVQRLTAKGEFPPVGGEAVDADAVFLQFCAACHGPNGAADSPAALAMNPHPRNFADKAWQASVDDARIMKVIKEGGGSVGLSVTMPAWSGQLNEAQVMALVGKVRSIGK